MPSLPKDTILKDCVLPGFHEPPTDYSYETVQFKNNVVAIWILCHRRFIYNDGNITRSIWGFYNTKTKQYHAPINSSKQGDKVELKDTTPYSAMQLNLNPLMSAFL